MKGILKSTKFTHMVKKFPDIHAKGFEIFVHCVLQIGPFFKARFKSNHGHSKVTPGATVISLSWSIA